MTEAEAIHTYESEGEYKAFLTRGEPVWVETEYRLVVYGQSRKDGLVSEIKERRRRWKRISPTAHPAHPRGQALRQRLDGPQQDAAAEADGAG